MKNTLRLTCSLLIIICASVVSALPSDDVTLGLMISGTSGDYLFSFSQEEEFMFVKFGGTQASFGILTATSLFEDLCAVFAGESFAGYQTTGVGLLDRGIAFGAPGEFQHLWVAGDTVASFSFSTEGGTVSERFEITDSDVEDKYAYVQFVLEEVIGDLWIEVLNGQLVLPAPPPPEEPKLRLLSFSGPAGGGGAAGQTPQQVVIEIVNSGNVPFSGPIECAIGLAYSTDWIPEWFTNFSDAVLGTVSLNPGEVGTYEVTVPVIPVRAIEELRRRQGLFTSYVDPDPDQDYIGLHLCMNKQHWCVFLPFRDQTQTAITRKPKL